MLGVYALGQQYPAGIYALQVFQPISKKKPTIWRQNTLKDLGVPYNSADIPFNSAQVAFNSNTAALAQSGKVTSSWRKKSKQSTTWKTNPLATANLYPYNSSSKTYNSPVDTYNGVVPGQDLQDNKTPTAWKRN